MLIIYAVTTNIYIKCLYSLIKQDLLVVVKKKGPKHSKIQFNTKYSADKI